MICICDRVASEASTDIIFLRAWVSLEARKFYNPVTSLLLEDKGEWTGMRLTGQVRREQGLRAPQNINSTYKVSSTLNHVYEMLTVL